MKIGKVSMHPFLPYNKSIKNEGVGEFLCIFVYIQPYFLQLYKLVKPLSTFLFQILVTYDEYLYYYYVRVAKKIYIFFFYS